MAAPGSLRCGFFVEKKKRFCKLEAGRGRVYCGEHAHLGEGGGVSRRVTCPLDPKHSVSSDKLQQHMKKCNSREKAPPVYFVKNRNSGAANEDEAPLKSLCDRPDLDSLILKLRTAAEGLPCFPGDRFLSHPVLQEQLDDPRNGGSAHKHLKQQSSILGHLEDMGLLATPRCFVEFGAGRGKLAHWILEALKSHEDQGLTPGDLQMVLVERSTTRFKVDGKHQDSGVQLERLQVDIQHLDLGRVPMIRSRRLPLVAVGKHLCGAATDLALRCLLENPEVLDPVEPPHNCPGSDVNSGPGPVQGLVLALCCHHRCQWVHYVGQKFFRDRGLGPDEFSAFCRMSSWATCGLKASEIPTDPESISRQEVGRLAKQLLDAGRRDFLSSRGLQSQLWSFVPPDVTPENVLLTAVVPATAAAVH